MDVSNWLASIGLAQYAETFRANDVDPDMLKDLTADDLREIGVASFGHRRKLLEAIAALAVPHRIQQVPAPPQTGPEKDAERRHLTVMFVDLVGSTELSTCLDPEDMRDVIRAYQNTVADEVTRFEGHVAKYMGDGVLAYFGWPRAHEDEAERAVRTGLAIAAAVTELPAPEGRPLRARIGIATGLVVVGDLIGEGAAQEEAVVGDTPNLAARLQGLAEPGTVVIAEATRRLVGQAFEVEDLGPKALKGIMGQTPAFRVLQERPLESRFAARQGGDLAPLVGRDQELGFLLERWLQAQSGEGQLVLLTGEAGIGKSRLTEALVAAARPDAATVLRYQCSPYHSDSPLYPVTQQIAHAAKLSGDAPAAGKLDRLEALLAMGTVQVGEAAPLVAELLGLEDAQARYGPSTLSPQQRRARTLTVLVDQIRGLARYGPMLWVLEDAHWIDPTTLELIELALDELGALRVLLLITARPTFTASFTSHPVVTRLALNRLARGATQAIARRIAGGKSLPDALIDEIAARTDGVPLFVEEMVKAVLESGALREREEAYILDGPLSALAVPTSLHDSLMARLDRLHGVKEVAQTASVIGRSFNHATLAALAGLPEERLVDALNRLVDAELVFRRGVPPQATYLFKHALVRDAAYDSLLRAKRRALHARVLELLEATECAPEVKARHAEAAGLAERAIACWEDAGKQALARPAYKEAIAHFQNALNLCPTLGGRPLSGQKELELALALGQALSASRGFSDPETLQAFERARALSEKIDDAGLEFQTLYGRWVGAFVAGQDSRELAEHFAERALSQPDSGLRLVGLRSLGVQRCFEGRFAESWDLLGKVLANYDPTVHGDLTGKFSLDQRAAAANHQAWNLFFMGLPEQAIRMVAENLRWMEQISHPNTTGQVLCYSAITSLWFGHAERAEELCRAAVHMAREKASAYWLSKGLIYLGMALSHMQQGSGLAELEEGLDLALTLENRLMHPLYFSIAADIYSRAGQHGEALSRADRAHLELDRGFHRIFASEIYRTTARALLRADAGRRSEAEAALGRALQIARDQKAPMLQLRAALEIAPLLVDRGEYREAYGLLSSIDLEIAERSEARDVRRAKALLSDLE